MRGLGSWILWGAVILAVLHAASFLGSGPLDDDFICYRFARNLLEGEGLVFNPGERIEGFTAPLWVLLMAGGMVLSLDPVVLSQSLSVLSCGVAALAVGWAWRTRFPASRWPMPALLVAASPAIAYHGAAGLGTTLLAALLALWLALSLRAERNRRAPWGAAIALALACLLRQEALLFALPFAFGPGRARGRGPGFLPLGALAAWTLFRISYYGRLLPMTYSVKKLPLAEDLGYGVSYFFLSTLVAGVGLYLVAALGARREGRGQLGQGPSATGAALTGLVLHTAYVVWVGGDYVALARFFVPTLPLAMYLACVGLSPLSRAVPGLAQILAWGGLILPQALQVKLGVASPLDDHCRPYLSLLHQFDEERWEALGRYFALEAPPGSTVALSPIGAFGWYSELKIVDVLGLTNESAADREPDLQIALKGHHRHNGAWVLSQEPDYMILGNGVRNHEGRLVANPWEAEIVRDERFQRNYVHELVPIPGGESLDLFRRRSAMPLPGAGAAGQGG